MIPRQFSFLVSQRKNIFFGEETGSLSPAYLSTEKGDRFRRNGFVPLSITSPGWGNYSFLVKRSLSASLTSRFGISVINVEFLDLRI